MSMSLSARSRAGALSVKDANRKHGQQLPVGADAKHVAHVIAGNFAPIRRGARVLGSSSFQAPKLFAIRCMLVMTTEQSSIQVSAISGFPNTAITAVVVLEDSLARRARCRELLDGLGSVNCNQFPGLLVAADGAGRPARAICSIYSRGIFSPVNFRVLWRASRVSMSVMTVPFQQSVSWANRDRRD